MVQSLYILLVVFIMTVLFIAYKIALDRMGKTSKERNTRLLFLSLLFFVLFIYNYWIGNSGLLEGNKLPPALLIYMVLPSFTLIGITINRIKKSKILSTFSGYQLAYFQSFRIFIESLFLASVSIGALHKEVTFEGYNYDILFASSALLIGFLAQRGIISNKVVLYWNYLGLIVIAKIVFLFITTTYFPAVWGSETSLAPDNIIRFPFVLVVSFLMPTAVFAHFFSIVKLRRELANQV